MHHGLVVKDHSDAPTVKQAAASAQGLFAREMAAGDILLSLQACKVCPRDNEN